MKVSAIIPTLNEEKNVAKVLKTISKYTDEVIIVDGYSEDKTTQIAKKFRVKILYDKIGKGSAIRKGIDHASGDILILFDCDLSHRAEEIADAINIVKSGYDICMPSRMLGSSYDLTVVRKFLNILLANFVTLVWGTKYTDVCYGFRVAKRAALKRLDLSSGGFEIETEISIKAAKKRLKIKEIPSIERKRQYGKGKFNVLSDGLKIINRIFYELIM